MGLDALLRPLVARQGTRPPPSRRRSLTRFAVANPRPGIYGKAVRSMTAHAGL